ncbi:hypothetical protein [Leeuwenhoekiella sp. NPDC079379]|uniref:hypothetical protein n=1 Tax=Leeuwenhoekiella sp. NPDC079379 TaxID=3364122 RepID=UPI0037CC3CE0
MKTKKLIFTLILGIIFSNSYSQISASFYQNESNSKIAIGYEFNDKLWTDFRLYSGTNIENITPEIVLNYNLVKKEKYETYIGAGIVLNNINGIVIPIGIGIKPFESLKKLSFNIELNPLYEIDFEDVFIRGFIGIRYVVK